MAAEIRLHASGGAEQGQHLLNRLAGLLQSQSDTPADALALAATANLLLPAAVASISEDDRLAADCAIVLLGRTKERGWHTNEQEHQQHDVYDIFHDGLPPKSLDSRRHTD
ncbi:hypothetical protein LGH82_17520 [Mesorhizobium sp. PAMC28654]|uniref:hypothetical protein n=1 Tax=Mesorhizobium sp. PAMC28654 TaxID=2880934 RepID=UPI001D0B82CF|nr:hypothetical protein [Mesorhizobium sp. PAMC28654]UDL87018.1 hypothetical protein LGH82_17520 [Mesorhizobium sp. PAMC28654]